MRINIEKDNLFNLPSEYVLCHCISLDCAMGMGIAMEFQRQFPGIREYCKEYTAENGCVVTSIIPYTYNNRTAVNLITKLRFSSKPTYNTIRRVLVRLRAYCIDNNIKYLGLPALGCGLDQLDFHMVLQLIDTVFKNTDIQIEIRLKEELLC